MYVVTNCINKGQFCFVAPYYWFIYCSKVNHNMYIYTYIYIYSHIELARLYYIGLHYRILEEKLECNYVRSFVGFFFFFFASHQSMHSSSTFIHLVVMVER
jgi:hypothetical protein